MEEHSALGVTTSELFVIFLISGWPMFAAVAIASYRRCRCRCLSEYPIWKSVIIGAVAGQFWLLWLVFWLMDRKQIAQEWRHYRASRSRPGLELAGR